MIYPEHILKQVVNPIQYIGNEYNIIKKDTNNKIRILLSYPDLYSVGMSAHGHLLVYEIFNTYYDVYAERVYAPMMDMEALLRKNNIPLKSLETATPINDFDIIGFTLEYELTYTNMLNILDLGNIPLKSANRNDNHPIVIAGGTAVYNPKPIQQYIDAFFIGEAEAMSDDIVNILREYKGNRKKILEAFNKLEYVYVPLLDRSKDVKQIIADDLNKYNHLITLVPNTKIVHNRAVIELNRGCTKGCRFCQAGMIYRPVRENKAQNIIKNALTVLQKTGYKELTLLSLSATDYIQLKELLKQLNSLLKKEYSSISLPSLRLDGIDNELLEEISKTRKSGITIAIESPSEELKSIINKDISIDEIYEILKLGYKLGWKKYKLYFMIGLPFETDAHIRELIDFINTIARSHRQFQFNISISPFVPRPFTPFQWVEQENRVSLMQKIDMIQNNIKGKNIEISIRDINISLLEGVFARGDERLNELIEAAFNNGARLDEWGEYFKYDIWENSARQLNIDFNDYLHKREINDVLPWDNIKTLISKEFLINEYNNAKSGKYTNDCREYGCIDCKACNGEIAFEKKKQSKSQNIEYFKRRKSRKIKNKLIRRIKIFLTYSISKEFSFMSHLGVINMLSTAFKRSNIDFVYTEGFNPKIKMIFGPPKPVGVYSDMELVELFIASRDDDILHSLNRVMPEGIKFEYMKEFISDKMSIIKRLNRVEMHFKGIFDNKNQQAIQTFLNAEEFFVNRIKNNHEYKENIRQAIKSIQYSDNLIKVILAYNEPINVKLSEIIENILKIDYNNTDIIRKRLYREENGNIIEVNDL